MNHTLILFLTFILASEALGGDGTLPLGRINFSSNWNGQTTSSPERNLALKLQIKNSRYSNPSATCSLRGDDIVYVKLTGTLSVDQNPHSLRSLCFKKSNNRMEMFFKAGQKLGVLNGTLFPQSKIIRGLLRTDQKTLRIQLKS